MDDMKDLELDADGTQSNLGGAPQAVRKAISLNLTKKTKMRAKSSSTKSNKSSRRDRKDRETDDGMDSKNFRRSSKSYDKKKETEEDDREDEELDWSHTVIMIGEKVQDPMIHMCEECQLPILIYGRLNPCKHVFCFSCADKSNSICPRCDDRVDRIEPAGIGQIFVCSFGGSRNGVSGCRRSYLSQRDLIAHIKHRHEKEGSNIPEAELLRQQRAALRIPFFNSLSTSVAGGANVLINNLQTSASAQGLQNPMVIPGVQTGSQPQIFVDPNRLSLLQGQVQLQPLPQMALAAQTPFQGASATTAFLQTQAQQQFPPAGLPQGGPQSSGGRQPGDPRLNPNQQTLNMQGDWRGNPTPSGDWQGRSSSQSYYK